jgi:signal transduction histidine kinase
VTPLPSLLDTIAKHSVDLMMVIDRAGVVTWASASCDGLFEVGANVLELAHPDDDLHGLLGGESLRHRWRDREGSYRMFETVGRDLRADPSVRGVLLQSRDVTAAAQLEAMMTESTDAAYELVTMREELIETLRQLDRSKAQLSAALVHDLKTPLTVIMLTAKYVLEDVDKPDDLADHSVTIGRAADAMHRMVLDLLDIGRSEDGQLAAAIANVDVGELFAELGERAKPLLIQRKQQLTCEIETPALSGDAELLGRVIQNLLDNCTKYAPAGSQITMSARRVGDNFELAVADRGPGIPDAFKTKVFDLYTRIDRDARSARTSRGVGLAFCKLALDAHRGSIVVEDRPDGGSVFRCRWPVDLIG